MSIKRIIELEEVKVNGQKYYKAVGCNTLFFDKNGFDKITKPLPKVENVKENLLNCKFVVIESKTKNMSVGKVYTVTNGFFRDNENVQYPFSCSIKSYEELEEYLCGEKLGVCHYTLNGGIKIIKVVE